MLRVRDTIDAQYAEPLDLAALATLIHLSPDHLVREFRGVFGETPHRYLQRRRIERAMQLLRATELDITEICLRVGFSSLGTFSRTFSAVVGESPSDHRRRGPLPATAGCFLMAWQRPSSATHPGRGSSVSEKRDSAGSP